MALARFKDLCIDVSSTERLMPFWAAVLGYDVVRQPDGSSYLRSPATDQVVWINEVPEPRTVKNRIHLDVHSGDVAGLLELGATVVQDLSEHERWWLLADPDGGEFCAFPREELPAERLYEVVVDCVDHRAQADWWGRTFGCPVDEGERWSALTQVPGLAAEYLVFQDVPEPKTAKNRIHWDVNVDAPEALDELVSRGAALLRGTTPADDWHVLTDPEGNEFCVFRTDPR